MSSLDVMYQVYGPPPQPYFTSAYSPYHHQKLAFYSKMQEESVSSSAISSFSNLPGPTSIKEEDCGRDKEHPPEAEYLNSRCVLFSYFHGDISSVVDEHFSRALSQPSSYAPGVISNKSARGASFPMSQRSFPPSFWNSAYHPAVPSSVLSSPHSELTFPGDPYSPTSLHSHLHQPNPDSWHPSHHHHHHHHHPYSLGGAIGSQGSAYSRPGMHEVYGAPFDPRYGSLLVQSVRPHRLAPGSSVAGPGGSPCDLGGKAEAGTAWATPFSGAGAEIGLNVDAGLQAQDKSKDLYWF
ncbi:transcription cofactor vestigial-like protein 2a isoform 2-T2 [Aplochiton taeniatus]